MDNNLRAAYRNLVTQMARYAGNVAANIGGGYHDYKSVEQPGVNFVPVSRSTQKRAMAWLDEYVFTEPAWLISEPDRKSTRLNSSHANISYAVFCLKKKKNT